MHSLNRFRPAITTPLHRLLTWRLSCTQLFVGGMSCFDALHLQKLQISSIPQGLAGLSYDTNESILKNAFEEYGEIIEVKVICDRVSGKSRGYGFVSYSSEVAASKALKEMDGQLLDGRNIRIHHAHGGGGQGRKDE